MSGIENPSAASSPARRLTFAGGAFGKVHRQRIGALPDLSGLAGTVPPALVDRVAATWRERTLTEFRSIQIMARFLTEVTGAGDPLDVYAGVVELVEDEIRHTESCAAICRALGAPPLLPDPVPLVERSGFVKAPMAERALATAITMLGVNETISAGYIADLAARCRNPAIKQVLDATIADEDQHHQLGWSYIRQSLLRFPRSTLPDWRHLVTITLEPHESFARASLEAVDGDRQRLEAWSEPELADVGLFSPQRQALVYRHTLRARLAPRLAELELLPSNGAGG
jgi:hypothetical protein